MRLNATTHRSRVLARMTPRLADRLSGFSTHGNPTPRAASTGFSLSAMRRKRGTDTPAAARHWRIWYLSRAAATAAGALARSPSRSAMAAAAAAVTASTPTAAASGRRRGAPAARRGARGARAESARGETVGRERREGARLLGGADEIDAERVRGVDEIFGAIRAGGQEQEETRLPAHRTHGGVLTAGRSGFAGGVVGVRPLRVIGRVEYL